MKQNILPCLLLGLVGLVFGVSGNLDSSHAEPTTAEISKKRLAIVWTSGDPEVAHRMVLMYLHAAEQNDWFAETRLIVWGPSSRLLAADKDLQAKIQQMKDDGVIVEACVVCANSYGVSAKLRELGLTVKGMGKPLSDLIHDEDCQVLTF